ncbi:hypothetical protein EV641_106283 [Rhodococcus sp. SMB37]|nr:hypothetical protein EV641_106283 [Rhodococcus sp. SMB37]
MDATFDVIAIGGGLAGLAAMTVPKNAVFRLC